jgi:hypothetical protein
LPLPLRAKKAPAHASGLVVALIAVSLFALASFSLGLYRKLAAGAPRQSRRPCAAIGSRGRFSRPTTESWRSSTASPGWRRLHSDGVAVVHVRESAASSAGGSGGE